MATATATKTTTKKVTVNKAAPVEQTETKEEPTVVTDQRLGKILKQYGESEKQTQSIWLQIVEHVKESELTRDVVKATYMQYRGVQENTALVEVSLIFTACKEENEENLAKAINGDMSVREFRKSIMKPREGKEAPDPEKKLNLRLKQASRYAIEKCDMDDPKAFARMAREQFTTVLERYAEAEDSDDSDNEDNEPEETDETE